MKKLIIPILLVSLILTACGAAQSAGQAETSAPERVELSYAKEFTIDRYADGSTLLTIGENRYLVIPENGELPERVPEGTLILQRPIENVYLQATSAMDLICTIDALDHVRLSGTQESGWYVPAAAEAMARGDILYAGKYSAPDYETILENGCGLAIESTMILHKPEVIEQLSKLGVPTLIERSSYENDPLGRMEWIKLYGVLFGKEELAGQIFEEKTAAVRELMNSAPTGKSAAFFYINGSGSVTVHKPGGYVSRMVELAGGKYLPEGEAENDSALSTENMQLEAFYAAARDADVLIYNSAIDGGIASVEELCAKWELLSEFKAVREGNVWCTDRSLFQQSMSLGELIADMHAVFTENETAELKFLYRLN